MRHTKRTSNKQGKARGLKSRKQRGAGCGCGKPTIARKQKGGATSRKNKRRLSKKSKRTRNNRKQMGGVGNNANTNNTLELKVTNTIEHLKEIKNLLNRNDFSCGNVQEQKRKFDIKEIETVIVQLQEIKDKNQLGKDTTPEGIKKILDAYMLMQSMMVTYNKCKSEDQKNTKDITEIKKYILNATKQVDKVIKGGVSQMDEDVFKEFILDFNKNIRIFYKNVNIETKDDFYAFVDRDTENDERHLEIAKST